jgi:hypothetical protein
MKYTMNIFLMCTAVSNPLYLTKTLVDGLNKIFTQICAAHKRLPIQVFGG